MNIKNAQLSVDKWINKYGVRYFNELTNMAQLCEEVGEVARIISRRSAHNPLAVKALTKTLVSRKIFMIWFDKRIYGSMLIGVGKV